MPYPSATLFPSSTLFPGTAAPVAGGDRHTQMIQVAVGNLVLTGTDAVGVAWLADTLTGWWGSPGSSLQATRRARSRGSWGSPRSVGSRTLTVAGATVAPSVPALRDAMDRLNAAISLEDTLLTVSEGGLTRSMIVTRQDEVLWARTNPVTADWSIQLTALDPLKFTAAITGSTGLPSTSGGYTFPLSFPWVFGETVVSGRVQLVNPGNASGPVVLRLDGPLTGPQVAHATTGVLFAASSLVLRAGEFLLVDMEAQTALLNGQASRNAAITQRGWSSFVPDVNEWDLSAVSGSGQLTVTATPSWL